MKKEEVRIASAVKTVESTPCATANIIFAGSLAFFEFLMQSTGSPVSNDAIRSQTSFSVSRYVLLDQKLKARETPEGCSKGMSKGAELESSIVRTVAMFRSMPCSGSSRYRGV